MLVSVVIPALKYRGMCAINSKLDHENPRTGCARLYASGTQGHSRRASVAAHFPEKCPAVACSLRGRPDDEFSAQLDECHPPLT
jgi:hypothetical protein